MEQTTLLSLNIDILAKEIFFANMGHEIRTPMNAIIGISEQMAKTKLDKKHKIFLSTIHSSVNHLTVIIKDILDLWIFQSWR